MNINAISSVDELKSLLSIEWQSRLNIPNDIWERIYKTISNGNYYPKKCEIFNALNTMKLENIKCVIIGQDPYQTKNFAHGYSFSVKSGVQIPKSLQNIFKELQREYNMNNTITNGCLEKWIDEGVLLLNSILTVEPNKSLSHKNIGWEYITNEVIKYIDKNCICIFMSWGNEAKKICSVVTNNMVIYSGHPSPLNTSVPFYGCDCFMRANDELMKFGVLPVRWHVLWS